MVANIISRHTYTLSDTITVAGYNLSLDSDYGGKSQIVLPKRPIATEDDFIILQDGGILFQGIISAIENEKGKSSYTITVLEMQRLFDQKLLLENETLLATGVEDFIADQIRRNFIENQDGILNIGYLHIWVKTHTPIAAAVENDNGIYNLCTYIGNALTNYGIFLSFGFTRESLNIIIEKKGQADLKFDTATSDIINLTETYEVKALTKLTVLWQQTADEVTMKTVRHFFLKTDRTITENMADPGRAKGSTDVVVSTAENEDAMKQEAYDKFKANSYNHKITFDFLTSSRLNKMEEMYIGHKCLVKTKSGIKESIITGISRSNTDRSINVTLGNMKIDLIDKLKGVMKG